MILELRGKVAVVTGGSMGIGKACVEAFARQGVRVAACARGIDALREVAEEISTKTETEVLPIRADATNSDDVRRFVTAAYEQFGRLDILVNSAVNFVHRASWLDLTDEHFWNHFNVKLIGNVRFAREVLPYMKEHKWGRIINMAGSNARHGSGQTSGLNNAAVINFTKVLSDEVAKDGITVNAIHPTTHGLGRGGVEYDGAAMRDEDQARAEQISIEELRERRVQTQRPGPQAGAEDTANLVLFLSSDKAAAITGQVIAAYGSRPAAVYY